MASVAYDVSVLTLYVNMIDHDMTSHQNDDIGDIERERETCLTKAESRAERVDRSDSLDSLSELQKHRLSELLRKDQLTPRFIGHSCEEYVRTSKPPSGL